MKLTWLKKLFTGTGTVVLAIYGIIGTVATLLTISGCVTIPVRALSIGGLIVIAIVACSVASIINCYRSLEEESYHPVHEFDTDEGTDYLYIAYTRDIRSDALVALYSKIEKKDKRIGFGIVHNVVQDAKDEYIEIKILNIADKYQTLYSKALQNNKKILKNMYVVPCIYRENIPELAAIMGGNDDAEGESYN